MTNHQNTRRNAKTPDLVEKHSEWRHWCEVMPFLFSPRRSYACKRRAVYYAIGQAFTLSTSDYSCHKISQWCRACDFAHLQVLWISKARKQLDILFSPNTLVGQESDYNVDTSGYS